MATSSSVDDRARFERDIRYGGIYYSTREKATRRLVDGSLGSRTLKIKHKRQHGSWVLTAGG